MVSDGVTYSTDWLDGKLSDRVSYSVNSLDDKLSISVKVMLIGWLLKLGKDRGSDLNIATTLARAATALLLVRVCEIVRVCEDLY